MEKRKKDKEKGPLLLFVFEQSRGEKMCFEVLSPLHLSSESQPPGFHTQRC